MIRKILAATAALTLGLGGVLVLAAPASAAEDCTTETTGWVTESPGPNWKQTDKRTVTDKEAVADSYTEWENKGETEVTEENEAPGPNTDTVRWILIGETDEEVVTPGQHYVHAHNEGDDPLGNDEVPPTPSEDPSVWQANTEQEPPGHENSATWVNGGSFATGGLHYTSHGNPNDDSGEGRRDWFYYQAPVLDSDYIWQKQVREFVPGEDAVTHQEFKFEKTTCTEVPVDDPKDPPQQNNPPKADAPPELPHTGGNLLTALVGLALTGAGGALTLLGYRRPSVV